MSVRHYILRERSSDEALAGFSLIELMVTIAIAGILVSIAWVRMATLVPIYRLEGSATVLATEIQKARGRAISENMCVMVVFDVTAKTYQLRGRVVASLPCGTTTSDYTDLTGEGVKQIDDARSLTVAFTQGANPIFTPRGAVENTPSPVIRLTNTAGAVRSIYVQSNARISVQ